MRKLLLCWISFGVIRIIGTYFSNPQLDSLLKAEPLKGSSDPIQARIQLSQHQERQNHVRHLYKLAMSLTADITTTVQQPVRCGHELVWGQNLIWFFLSVISSPSALVWLLVYLVYIMSTVIFTTLPAKGVLGCHFDCYKNTQYSPYSVTPVTYSCLILHLYHYTEMLRLFVSRSCFG